MKPKVFLSYSWSRGSHQQFVVRCAERLIADGVEVVLDVFDLKEGQDKHHFMERMVADKTVTHVLLFCDRSYAEKANARSSGVGTESQIVSKEIYSSVEQAKFIPLACEFDDKGEAYLPVFLRSRIWIDFSSPEAVNKNWEQLVRLLYGKPLLVKPQLGKPPAYITAEQVGGVSIPAVAKFATFRQAITEDRKNLRLYRQDFLDACFVYADNMRVRVPPAADTDWGQKILADSNALVAIRDLFIDWILFESQSRPSIEFNESVIEMLEKVRELRARPNEVTSYSDHWFEAMKLFGYELFLYLVAALVKTRSFELLREIFTTHYPTPLSERHRDNSFDKFGCFYAYSEILNPVLSPPGQKLHSAAAELLKRHATRSDIPFGEILQADLLSLLMAFIQEDVRWYPQTLYYASFARTFPLFERATQRKHFASLAKITGIADAGKLREEVEKGHKRLQTERWNTFYFDRTFWASMNMDKLDTLT